MDWIVNQNDITDHIISLEQSILNPIIAYSEVISYLKKILWNYREYISQNDFANNEAEIIFFKQVKTYPLSYLFQFKRQLEFEIEFKNFSTHDDFVIIENEIQSARKFLSYHQGFIVYMEMKRTDNDEFYFLRKDHYNNEIPSSSIYSYDKLFCTSYDSLWSEIQGTNRYIEFLKRKITVNKNQSTISENTSHNINWTGSKVALTELAIALKYSGSLNNGNISFKDTILFLQDLFQTDLGEFHHTAMRLKNRSQPTKFIDNLKESVEHWIEKSDA